MMLWKTDRKTVERLGLIWDKVFTGKKDNKFQIFIFIKQFFNNISFSKLQPVCETPIKFLNTDIIY